MTICVCSKIGVITSSVQVGVEPLSIPILKVLMCEGEKIEREDCKRDRILRERESRLRERREREREEREREREREIGQLY